MKRTLTFVAILIAALSLLVGGTLSYRSVNAEAVNVITTGKVKMKIHEVSVTGEDVADEKMIILPGDTVSRIVTIENCGTSGLYLRIKLVKAVNDAELTAEHCLTMDINTTDWTYHDGYYYYNVPLQAGETTKPLFTEVHVEDLAVDHSYLGKLLTLDVMAYAVQSEHNGASVWEATGWPGM